MNQLDRILALALRAMSDPEALPVLGDLIIETRWTDPRVANLMSSGKPYAKLSKAERRHFFGFSAAPTVGFAAAVAAVLMCRRWWKSRWIGVESSYVAPPITSVQDILRALWPQARLSESVYAQSPFISMISKATR